jgi:phosphate ABC transporter phosphate-binding protein
MTRLSITGSTLRSAAISVVLSLLIVLSLPAQAQTADALGHVRKIYIDTSAAKPDATEMRKHLLDSLRNDRSLEIVTEQSQADALLKVSSEIWVKAYISVNPRSSGSKYPVYGGFLSAQLIGKNGDALWSYLVTPSKYASSGIHQDLSDQLIKNLLAALHDAASSSPAGPGQPTLHLRIAGATFPAPLYQAWIESFQQHRSNIQITYSAVGSQAGIQQLRDNKVTFAASDVPLSDADMAQMHLQALQFATVIGAVVPIYHLPQASQDLHFTPDVLAGIYLGKIRRWNDPAIRDLNHGITLPDAEIIVIHRSDGSGTTFAFTNFLSQTNPAWKSAIGTGITVNWPIGRSAQGNDGVAALVEQTPNSIGYAELSFAIQRQLSYGTVRNAAGNFTQANLITIDAAAASVSTRGNDILTSLTNAPGKNAYPITSFTWFLVPESISDPATKSAVADFLDWILTTGQKECSALAYTPLPKEIVAHQQDLLAKFKSGK